MIRKILLAVVICLSLELATAMPLYVMNNSNNPSFDGVYDVSTFILYHEQGGNPCDYTGQLFTLLSGSMVQLEGGYMYTSPYNGSVNCLGSLLPSGGSCATPLDWDGLRVYSFHYTVPPATNPSYTGYAGVIQTGIAASSGCVGGYNPVGITETPVVTSIGANSYYVETSHGSVNYVSYGSVAFLTFE